MNISMPKYLLTCFLLLNLARSDEDLAPKIPDGISDLLADLARSAVPSLLNNISKSLPESLKECQKSLDIVLVQDLTSWSMDLGSYSGQVAGALSTFLQPYPESRVGLVTVTDKPIPPFGAAGDYCFNMKLAPTTNLSLFNDIYDSQPIFPEQGDFSGAQYQAMMSAFQYRQMGWRNSANVARVVVMVTYTTPHYFGDSSETKAPNLYPNDGKTTQNNVTVDCIKKQYPLPQQVSAAVSSKKNQFVVFLIGTDSSSAPGQWQWVNDGLLMQPSGMFQTLASWSTDFVDKMKAGLQTVIDSMTC